MSRVMGRLNTLKAYACPMHRCTQRAAGGTIQRLKPGPATVRSRSRNESGRIRGVYCGVSRSKPPGRYPTPPASAWVFAERYAPVLDWSSGHPAIPCRMAGRPAAIKPADQCRSVDHELLGSVERRSPVRCCAAPETATGTHRALVYVVVVVTDIGVAAEDGDAVRH